MFTVNWHRSGIFIVNLTSKFPDLSFWRKSILEIFQFISQFSLSGSFQNRFFLYELVLVPSLLPYSYLYRHACEMFWIFLIAYLPVIFSMISAPNPSCDVPLTHLFLLGAKLSITAIAFWMKFSISFVNVK